MHNGNIDAGTPGVDLFIPDPCPDMGDIMPICAEVFAYVIARYQNGLAGPLRTEDIGRDVGIHELTVREALEQLRDRGFIQVRPRGAGAPVYPAS